MDRLLIENMTKECITDSLGMGPGEVLNQSRIEEDLKMDSLDLVELVLILEEKFAIILEDDMFERNRYPEGMKVIDLVGLIAEQLVNKEEEK